MPRRETRAVEEPATTFEGDRHEHLAARNLPEHASLEPESASTGLGEANDETLDDLLSGDLIGDVNETMALLFPEKKLRRPGEEESHQDLGAQQTSTASAQSVKILTQDALAVHSDSGYASNDVVQSQSRVNTYMDKSATNAPSELPVANSAEESHYENRLQPEADYEIASVLSDDDDNRSIGVITKSRPVLEAQAQIRALFALNEDLQSLATDLLARMGRQRFVENLRRLLMSYYKLQKQLARSNLEHAVVALLGSRTLREGIAVQVADTLVPTSEQMRLDHEENMERIRDARSSVEAWLSSNLAFALHPDALEQDEGGSANVQHYDLSDSDDEDHADKPQAEYAHITTAAQFLSEGDAFENLLLDMQVLLIPNELRMLAHTLLRTPKGEVRMDREFEPTFWNKCKIFVDELTHVDWNWWPLAPVIPTLPRDRVRIWWKCHCGDELWEDIPESQAHLFDKLLSLRKSGTRGSHLCQTAFKRRDVALRTHSPPSNGPSTSARASAAPSAGNAGMGQPILTVPSPALIRPGSSSASGSINGSSSTGATSVGSTTIAMPHQQRLVLLGVSGMRRTLNLEHINVVDINTDAEFFTCLKTRYRSARGFLRFWFSIWRLDHCEFVKFRKYRPGRVIGLGKDLPKDTRDYTYSPRPPEATVSRPPIVEHEWKHALHPCEGEYMGVNIGYCLFGWIHDCFESFESGSRGYIDRIPQKHTDWLIQDRGVDHAFGILTKEEPSILYVLVYHVLILAGPFAFWGWAMPRESKKEGFWDLQNPSVPATFALGLLSFIWSLFWLLWSNKGEKEGRA